MDQDKSGKVVYRELRDMVRSDISGLGLKAAQLPEKQQPLKTDAERARARATRKAKLKWKGDDELHEVRSYIPAAAPPSAGLHGDGLVVAIGDDEE